LVLAEPLKEFNVKFVESRKLEKDKIPLLTSAILIGLWAYYGKHGGILLLQLFYASAGIIGMVRWF